MSGRPDDCICWDDSAALPCFPCAREGFDTPNSDPPEETTDTDAYPATVEDTTTLANTRDTDEDLTTVATDGGSRFTLPESGSVVYDKRYGGSVAEALVLKVRPNTAAKDVIVLTDGGVTLAEIHPDYSPDAPVVEVAKVRSIERTLGEEWSVEDVHRAVADGEITSDTLPASMFSETLGEEGSPFYKNIRQRTTDIDGIGVAKTEAITREFDNLTDIEHAVAAFPDNERRFQRCRSKSTLDGTLEIVHALEDVVESASQTTLPGAGGVDQ